MTPLLTLCLTLALSGPSISQQIKLPKLDQALARHGQEASWERRGERGEEMGFCRSWEYGNCARCADHNMPCYTGRVGPSVLLRICNFSSVMRLMKPRPNKNLSKWGTDVWNEVCACLRQWFIFLKWSWDPHISEVNKSQPKIRKQRDVISNNTLFMYS